MTILSLLKISFMTQEFFCDKYFYNERISLRLPFRHAFNQGISLTLFLSLYLIREFSYDYLLGMLLIREFPHDYLHREIPHLLPETKHFIQLINPQLYQTIFMHAFMKVIAKIFKCFRTSSIDVVSSKVIHLFVFRHLAWHSVL